jgi:hypothetical protein
MRQVAEPLSIEYGWVASSAAAWLIMEDMEPRSGGINVQVTRGGSPVEPDVLVFGKVESLRLQVSAPLDIPPHALLYEIQKVQERFSSRYVYPMPSTSRPYLDSTLQAVRFAIERNTGRSWLSVLEEWNEGHPDSEFEADVDGAAAFGAIVRRCYSQTMGKKLEWKKRPGKPSKNK